MSNSMPITREGYNNLIEEYERLAKIDLPAIISKVSEASKHGDLKENAEYHAAIEHQNHIQRRIEYLRDRISRSQIMNIDTSKMDTIVFGCVVKILDLEDETEEEFTLVGPAEGDPDNGRISTTSPIGRNLLGKKVDDIVEIETPGGVLQMKVLSFK